jgi:hypothetical protein
MGPPGGSVLMSSEELDAVLKEISEKYGVEIEAVEAVPEGVAVEEVFDLDALAQGVGRAVSC